MAPLEKHHVIQACLAAGACAARVSPTSPPAQDLEAHASWLQNYSGHAQPSIPGLSFLFEHLSLKSDVRHLWPQAQSVVCVAVAFDCLPEGEFHRHKAFSEIRSQEEPRKLEGHISSYAQWADYHLLMRHLLDGVGRLIKTRTHGQVDFRVCVDTDPLLEKGLARGCGLGWIGRNSCLIVPHVGSRVVLGELLLDHRLPPDEPLEGDPCEGCRVCQDACPTRALEEAYTLDAARCLAYLTIEHPGDLPQSYAAALENRLFGCDTCVAVCPHNASPLPKTTPTLASLSKKEKASPASAPTLPSKTPFSTGPWVSLKEVSSWGSRQTTRKLKGTALSRLSPSLLRRNLCHVLANLKTPETRDLLAKFRDSPSARVRSAALQEIGRASCRERVCVGV